MNPVRRIEGRAYPLGLANVDTDMIIAAEHLKTISRVGLGRHVFTTLRAKPGNPFDDSAYQAAPILIAGANFGCGSSREHAVWALADFGIRAVIAPSFSDIFSSNAFKNGFVAVALEEATVDRLLQVAADHIIAIDLESMTISSSAGDLFAFTMDPFRRECLLEGRDEIALTLLSEQAIRAYEVRTGS